LKQTGTRESPAYKYLFGPVPSRRLGRSLGVDLVPAKTCPFDCLFCEAGPTTLHTIERREYVPIGEVLAELDAWLHAGGVAEYVTLSGAGEPTLHTSFGKVLDFVRSRRCAKSALLTNSSLLGLQEVSDAAARADLVKASLSAWDEESFRTINRPPPQLTFDRVVNGLTEFRARYSGIFWIEVMVVAAVNSTVEAMRRIRAFVEPLKPSRVHLNTVIRTPAYPDTKAVPDARMDLLAACFEPRADVTTGVPATRCATGSVSGLDIMSIIRRRPCTVADITAISGLGSAAIESALAVRVAAGEVLADVRPDGTYYRAAR